LTEIQVGAHSIRLVAVQIPASDLAASAKGMDPRECHHKIGDHFHHYPYWVKQTTTTVAETKLCMLEK
jgi:hypothetical protein